MNLLILIILILLIVGLFPAWPYARSWYGTTGPGYGYFPFGLIILILILFLLFRPGPYW